MNWFNYSNFYDFISDNKNFNVFVELGVWEGDSISYLAKKLISRRLEVKVYGIDIFEDWNKNQDLEVKKLIPNIRHIFNDRLIKDNVRDMVVDIKGISWEMAAKFEDNSVDFVFIDADHSYESVKKDMLAWLPKIKKTVLFQDTTILIHAELSKLLMNASQILLNK